MDDGLEWLRAMYAESCVPDSTICDCTRFGPDLDSVVIVRQKANEESFMITDARAPYDLFHSRSGAAGLCRRAQIDVSVMASSAQTMNAPVCWIPGVYMIADCLTKRVGNSTFMRKVMLSGLSALQPEPLKALIDTASDAPLCDLSVRCCISESLCMPVRWPHITSRPESSSFRLRISAPRQSGRGGVGGRRMLRRRRCSTAWEPPTPSSRAGK